MSEEVLHTRTAEETTSLGAVLARELRCGDVVHLRGPLGAGKSVFARGVGKALGAERWRGSPTFNLVHEYDTEPRLYHLDLYRLTEDEVEELHLEEAAEVGVLVVEWAERAANVLSYVGRRHVWVEITPLIDEGRRIDIAWGEVPCR